ncbi:MAG: DivIVA domain-containing protein [Acidimicrobiales bacterium]
MELSPQAVAAATFRTVKRGYDPDEVRAYLIEVSASLEAAHQQATAMEARARAAIAKLQDATQLAQQTPATTTGPVPVTPAPTPTVGAEEAETISRTLLLAQRTADHTVAEAKAEAAQITEAAHHEAASVTSAAKLDAAAALEQARAEAARLLDDARAEAHRAKSESHLRAEAEVAELERRREALTSDLAALERATSSHRDRLRDVSKQLAQLAEGVPSPEQPTLSAPSAPAAPAAAPASNGAANGRSPITGQVPVTGSITAGPSDDTGGNRIPPPPITGQVPLQPGVEPLVSPRPTSADEVRSMWQQAERAELESQGLIDATPIDGITAGGDSPTPTDGIRR